MIKNYKRLAVVFLLLASLLCAAALVPHLRFSCVKILAYIRKCNIQEDVFFVTKWNMRFLVLSLCGLVSFLPLLVMILGIKPERLKSICMKPDNKIRFSFLVFLVFAVVAILIFINTASLLDGKLVWALTKHPFVYVLFLTGFHVLTLALILIGGFVFFNYNRLAIHKIFFIFFLLFGLSYLLLFRMWSIPNEMTHWFRIFEIAEGHLVSEAGGGRSMPQGLILDIDSVNGKYTDLAHNRNIQINRNEKMSYWFAGAALYSPATYTFQLIGLKIASAFTDRTLLLMYAARFSAFVLSLFVLTFAIKKIPVKQKSFFMLAMTPVFFQEAVSLAGDSLANTLAFAFTALILAYSLNKEEKRGLCGKAGILLIAVFLSLVKVVYLPLVLLIFLLPVSCFSSKKSRTLFLASLLLLCVVLNLIWLGLAKGFLSDYRPDVDPAGQFKYIVTHPVEYIKILLDTYTANFKGYFVMFMGQYLTWAMISVNHYFISAYKVFLFLVLLSEHYKHHEYKKLLRLFLFISLSVIILIATSLYIQWTVVGSSIIEGIQGRYFIPVSILLALCINIHTIRFGQRFKLLINNAKLNEIKLCLDSDLIFKYALLVVAIVNLQALSSLIGFYT
ncbi:MAG: DUF2142 domain-containing protein [Spirochaetaceae bacterium]|jgi:uncharacterized membrane protein|nr:DUF2142 domain-containing protein [Spirochaetaceae bacterium]